jgi:ABC-2 type transport system ATP-binding protein
MAEVEALCDQVLLLRDGRLVEASSIAALRHLKALRIEATFNGPAPTLPPIDGVAEVARTEDSLSLDVVGEVGQVLAALAPYRPVRFRADRPSLEELFLSHYGPTAR